MNQSQLPHLNPGNDDDFFAESSIDLKEGLTATEISMTAEEIDRVFNGRFADAANEEVFNVTDSVGAENIMANSKVTTTLMAA